MSILRSQSRRDAHTIPHPLTALDRATVFVGVLGPPVGAAVAIYSLWHRGVGPVDLALMAGMYFLTLLGITLGYHRLFTHRSFATPAAVRFVLAVLGSMALQGPVIQWVAHHRRHHQVSDRQGDPHSPHLHEPGLWNALKQAWHAHAGWLFGSEPENLRRSVPDLLADPVVAFVDRTFWYWVVLGLVLPGIAGGLIAGTWFGAFTGFLWGGLVRMAATHHVTGSINSVCHIWGSKEYQSADESRNNTVFGVLALGEGWHNNHHAFPTSARHGLKWYQFDATWITLRVLSALGLARDLRLPSNAAMNAKRANDAIAPADDRADTLSRDAA
jgi:stearoyl-CoA desaturase (delta-9 desaturase)